MISEILRGCLLFFRDFQRFHLEIQRLSEIVTLDSEILWDFSEILSFNSEIFRDSEAPLELPHRQLNGEDQQQAFNLATPASKQEAMRSCDCFEMPFAVATLRQRATAFAISPAISRARLTSRRYHPHAAMAACGTASLISKSMALHRNLEPSPNVGFTSKRGDKRQPLPSCKNP